MFFLTATPLKYPFEVRLKIDEITKKNTHTHTHTHTLTSAKKLHGMGTGLLIDENEYFFKTIFYCFDYQTAS